MLRFLRIRNLAVIEAVEVEFEPGFNVLTGETGAGKSILIEAVALLLGGRASSDLVRTGEAVATIEAIFEHGGEEKVVRREITAQGRSRSFIDGALATAGGLRDLSRELVEMHGQHEHQTLLEPASHLPVLDVHAGVETLVAEVRAAWDVLSSARQELERATMNGREREARLEVVSFQLSEIERVSPRPDEDEELAVTRQVLASAERIQKLCGDSYAELYENDEAVLAALGSVRKRLTELAAIEPQFVSYLAASEAVKSQLEDLAWFLRDYGSRVDASPERLQEVETRLAAIERLKRKYGPSLSDVLQRQAQLAHERAQLDGGGARADEIARRVDAATSAYLELARTLSTRRREAAPRFATTVERLLAELAMPRARFELRFERAGEAAEKWGENGLDRAEFYLSANPGEVPRPLARIVSGGELSRVMLALKTMALSRPRSERPGGALPTLIFDEVDAGISGKVADAVGERLTRLGRETQVLCITHLPQIAACGTTQFEIAKAVTGGRTVTTVSRLSDAQRVEAVARMIAGGSVTASVRESARELLGRRPVGESESGRRGESESRRRARR
jgi:DNA repair protein RecN (Recombination protein N)